jgi:hypothetical protein
VAETDIAPEVIDFLRDHIDSVLELELLLVLRNAPAARAFTAADLAHELKIDAAHADAQLEKFCQRGLLACGETSPRTYRYAPQSPQLDAAVAAVAAAYAGRRVTMIGLIFSKPTSTLKTFADAFRIRGKDKDRPDHG